MHAFDGPRPDAEARFIRQKANQHLEASVRHAALCALVLSLACASGQATWAPVARTSPTSCAAPDQPPSQHWQLVPAAAAGFTFCVPGDWLPQGGRSWYGAGASITWDIGQAGSDLARFTIARVYGEVAGPGMRPVGPASCTTDRFDESIGGRQARLADTRCADRHSTSAAWSSPAVYMRGTAETGAAALLELLIYRTVRFESDSAR